MFRSSQAHHGDWYGGKAVGMAILNIDGLTAHIYITHVSSSNLSSHPHLLCHTGLLISVLLSSLCFVFSCMPSTAERKTLIYLTEWFSPGSCSSSFGSFDFLHIKHWLLNLFSLVVFLFICWRVERAIISTSETFTTASDCALIQQKKNKQSSFMLLLCQW